jgi:hypothetical protein
MRCKSWYEQLDAYGKVLYHVQCANRADEDSAICSLCKKKGTNDEGKTETENKEKSG